jgi:hypothetical protein
MSPSILMATLTCVDNFLSAPRVTVISNSASISLTSQLFFRAMKRTVAALQAAKALSIKSSGEKTQVSALTGYRFIAQQSMSAIADK